MQGTTTRKQNDGVQMNMLDSALSYTSQGFRVFPLIPNLKRPATSNGCLAATLDEAQVKAWWTKTKTANIGLATGDGILALDFDCKHGQPGLETLAELVKKGLPINTLNSTTPTGGKHYLYTLPEGLKFGNRASALPGLDIRGDSGYIVVAPSKTTANAEEKTVDGCYEWADPNAEILPAPEWLLALLQQQQESRGKKRNLHLVHSVEEGTAEHAEAPPCIEYLIKNGFPTGSRNNALLSLGVYAKMKFPDAWEQELEALNLRYLTPGTPQEVQVVIKNLKKTDYFYMCNTEPLMGVCDKVACRGKQYGVGQGQENLTDSGNAERLVRLYGNMFRYAPEFKKWLLWDGSRWVMDTPSGIKLLAKATVRSMMTEAQELPDDQRVRLIKHSLKSETKAAREAMISLAESEPGIPIRQSMLDKDRYLFNVVNGTLELKTGQLRPAEKTDYITKRAAVEYDPAATCPTWEAFLDRAMAGNKAMIAYIQKAVGYSLTGSTEEQCIFIPHGEGSNGKSKFLEVLEYILADYSTHCAADALMVKNSSGGASSEIARLRGARFVAAVETDEGKRLSEALIKELTGGDTIAARFLFAEFFEFIPAFKLWLACNHKPVIRGTDHAIWRRIKLIPFSVVIPDHEQDKKLPEKLQAESAGILAWAVRGCLLWQLEGLNEPPEVKVATMDYRKEMDVIGAWIDARCETARSIEGSASALYEDFKNWAETNKEYILGNLPFSKKLVERGFTKTQKAKGIYYKGLGLKESKY
jgi:putative DNA primase/helicase